MSGTYIVDTVTGEGINLGTGRIGKTIKAVVKFDQDGRVAHSGPSYWLGDEPRNFKANAGRMAKRYQVYFDRTGKRWEVEQADKRKAEREMKEEARRKAKQVREAGPELLEACKIARRVVAKAVKAGDIPDNLLKTIDAAIARATA